MLGQMMQRPLLISHLIQHAANYHGDTPIISRETDGSTTHSDWKTIYSNSKRLANALAKLGIEQDDRLATIAWNNRRHLEIWYGLSGAGMVCHYQPAFIPTADYLCCQRCRRPSTVFRKDILTASRRG